MYKQAINNYYNNLDRYQQFGGTRNESSIRRAFANLLEEYCLSENLILVDELKLENSAKRPDGTINDARQIAYGYYESKDIKDDLDKEIDKKIKIGYPTFNILFENSEQIVLIQKDEEIMRGEMKDVEFLHRILTTFVKYEHPRITKFNKAVEKFKEDIPYIVEALREMIAKQSEENIDFKIQREKFWNICKKSINPNITSFDIREMLIQHILTAEIFNTVFDETHFHRENNIAKELENVINTFFTGKIRKNTLAKIDTYYKVIKKEASNIDNHHRKQKFLKIIYENFYKAYNPKGADILGVVYTPNEIVKFMVKSVDELTEKYFSKTLSDKNVQILDPATGTGTFITEILEYIPKKYLKFKYQNEIHCNELAILPYYIANLNIEYTYQQKMNEYEPFENIVFVDTLDNVGFNYSEKQKQMFDISTENVERIKKQNKGEISVIIGNPPYNANQTNENDNNKNREYNEIDKQIKNTYVHFSTAQKSKVYDMYSRFYRWATNRISKNGIIAFITNRSFIESRTFDGFRKSVEKEFDYIYIVDLNGDIRSKKEQAGGNVFGILTGVAIAFFIKKEEFDLNNKKLPKENAKIKYTSIFKEGKAKEKLEYLNTTHLKHIPFESVIPDKKNNWLNIPNNDFQNLIPLIDKKDKNTIFKFVTNGVNTARDEWVYDFDKKNLQNKIKYFIEIYNEDVEKLEGKKNEKEINNLINYKIKWSASLKIELLKHKEIDYKKDKIDTIFYRPFIKKHYYRDKNLSDRLTKNHFDLFGKNLEEENLLIARMGLNTEQQFSVLSANRLVDYSYLSPASNGCRIYPLYRNDQSGTRRDNITNWGLDRFREHYKLKEITKKDIFYYTYAVLHNPNYREKYKLNLKREFPRLPFYKDFYKWKNWGQELMNLHINYETVKSYDELIIKNEKLKVEKPETKLKLDKKNNEIILDENTTITNIPAIALKYKFGSRSAIEWILNQYKTKKYSKKILKKYPDKQILNEKFNIYKFENYKNQVIDLIKRITTVSVETVKITNKMKQELL